MTFLSSNQLTYKTQQTLLNTYLKLSTGGKQRKFVYYHLPRTAGTSLKHIIRQQGYANRILTLPHHANVRNTNFRHQNLVRFGAIRHPISWYTSYYNIKAGSPLIGSKGRVKNYATMSDNSFVHFFHDLVTNQQGVTGLKKWHKPWRPGNLGYELAKNYLPQYGFLTNLFRYYYFTELSDQLLPPDQIGVNTILHFENIANDLNQILQPAGITLSFQTRLKTASNVAAQKKDFTPQMLKQLSNQDYYIFNHFYPNHKF